MIQDIQSFYKLIDDVGYFKFVLLFIMLLVIIKQVWSLFSWFLEKFGIETKHSLAKKEDNRLLRSIDERLGKLEQQRERDVNASIKHDEEIEAELKKVVAGELKEKIENKRWRILDFESGIRGGRNYSKQQYEHILFEVYEDYEQIIEDNNLTNGKVDFAIEFISFKYKEMFGIIPPSKK